ncbi:hypothetical protein D3C84_916030 [compost metagenome]
MGDPTVVSILVNETLTALVDKDPLDQRCRRKERHGGEELLHIQGRRTDTHAHADTRAVVIASTDLQLASQGLGHEAPNHFLIGDKAAGTEDHPLTGPHVTYRAIPPHHQPSHGTVSVDDQRQRPTVVMGYRPYLQGSGTQNLH